MSDIENFDTHLYEVSRNVNNSLDNALNELYRECEELPGSLERYMILSMIRSRSMIVKPPHGFVSQYDTPDIMQFQYNPNLSAETISQIIRIKHCGLDVVREACFHGDEQLAFTCRIAVLCAVSILRGPYTPPG